MSGRYDHADDRYWQADRVDAPEPKPPMDAITSLGMLDNFLYRLICAVRDGAPQPAEMDRSLAILESACPMAAEVVRRWLLARTKVLQAGGETP